MSTSPLQRVLVSITLVAFLALCGGPGTSVAAARSTSTRAAVESGLRPCTVGRTTSTVRVGLQVGHWHADDLPAELQALRGNMGAVAGGYHEYQVNLAIAERAAACLRAAGVSVDVLPATIPPHYQADAFVALHADESPNLQTRGFKIVDHVRGWQASRALVDALRIDYGRASGFPWDGTHISENMRLYYGLSTGRFWHTIANETPGAIVELGYLTNPQDRWWMTHQTDLLASGVATGILHFLASKPATGWPAPPALP